MRVQPGIRPVWRPIATLATPLQGGVGTVYSRNGSLCYKVSSDARLSNNALPMTHQYRVRFSLQQKLFDLSSVSVVVWSIPLFTHLLRVHVLPAPATAGQP